MYCISTSLLSSPSPSSPSSSSSSSSSSSTRQVMVLQLNLVSPFHSGITTYAIGLEFLRQADDNGRPFKSEAILTDRSAIIRSTMFTYYPSKSVQ